MKHITFLDRATLGPNVKFQAFTFDHVSSVFDRTAVDEVRERIADAHVVVVNKVALRAEDLRQAPKLELIAVAATLRDLLESRRHHHDGNACRLRSRDR